MSTTATTPRPVRLGLRENLAQFSLLVGVNALVGGMIGQERTVLPLLAEDEFGLTSSRCADVHRRLRDRQGGHQLLRRHAVGSLRPDGPRRRLARRSPVPLLLMWAPTWGWVVFANVLLGVNQGLTWSTTVIMKIDLVGPAKRGLAMGLNEAAGYGAVAITRLATGYIAQQHGLRPAPFFLGLAYAGLGLGSRPCSSTRPAATPATKPPTTSPPTTPSTTSSPPARSSRSPRSGRRRCRRHHSRARQQPQRRPGVGSVPDLLRGRPLGRPHRGARRRLPGDLGSRPTRHGRSVRPDRPQTVDRRRHAHPGRCDRADRRHHRLLGVGDRRRPARCRHGHGVPDPVGGDR